MMFDFVRFLEAHKDYVSSINAIVTMIVALVALLVAYRGLRTWEKQLRGEDRYKAAKGVRKAAHVLRFLMDDRTLVCSGARVDFLTQNGRIAPEVFEKDIRAQAMAIRGAFEDLKGKVLDACVVSDETLMRTLGPLRVVLLQYLEAVTTLEREPICQSSTESERRKKAAAIALGTDKVVQAKYDAEFVKALALLESGLDVMLKT